MYTYRHVEGYSTLDHLAREIILRAKMHTPQAATKRQAAAALKAAIADMRAKIGPRWWPRIDIVGIEHL